MLITLRAYRVKECIEISLENLYVDTGAQRVETSH